MLRNCDIIIVLLSYITQDSIQILLQHMFIEKYLVVTGPSKLMMLNDGMMAITAIICFIKVVIHALRQCFERKKKFLQRAGMMRMDSGGGEEEEGPSVRTELIKSEDSERVIKSAPNQITPTDPPVDTPQDDDALTACLLNSRCSMFFIYTGIVIQTGASLTSTFRTAAAAYLVFFPSIQESCLEVVDGVLVQTPFNCVEPMDVAIIVSNFMLPIALILSPLLVLIVAIVRCCRRKCCKKETDQAIPNSSDDTSERYC